MRSRSLISVFVSLLLVLCFATTGMGKEINVLVVYSSAVFNHVQENIVPAFEATHGVQVTLINATWDNRMDKFMVMYAGGTPPDVISTGFYSSYLEGSMGLLAPLDGYLANWKNKARIPQAMWESLKWDGKVRAVPLDIDIRGYAYNKDLFRQAGYDPNKPPQSWEEMVRYARRLTRQDGERVTVRGIGVSRTGKGGTAQELFWFMQMAGIPEVTDNLASNLSRPETLSALETLVELHDAALLREPGVANSNTSFYNGAIAMQRLSPIHATAIKKANPELLANMGLFAPRKDVTLPQVAHGFINGLGIPAASSNKDIAWKFIETLLSDEYVYELQQVSGWLGGRTDLVNKMTAVQPGMSMWYELFAYFRASTIPPPRDQSQNDLGALMLQVYNKALSPQAALEQAHKSWTIYLHDWQEQISGAIK